MRAIACFAWSKHAAIERAAYVLHRGQQDVILHVEDARGVVGALEESAQAREVERLAAHDGAIGDAAEEMRALLHPVEELGGAGAGDAVAGNGAHLEPGGVQRLPHLGGDQPAHRVPVLARPFQARVDRGRVLLVERHEFDQRGQRELVVRSLYAASVSVMASGASRFCSCSLPVSSSTRLEVTPRMRAMFSARSIWRLIQKMRSATRESISRPPRYPSCRRPATNSPPASLHAA